MPKTIISDVNESFLSKTLPHSKAYLLDCMVGMKSYTDNFFDLAVIDPPYGIEYVKKASKKSGNRYGKQRAKKNTYTSKEWDNEPCSAEYFAELFRISKNQVIFGANHFISRMPYDSPCWLCWDKNNGTTDFADFELAWTSFKTPARFVKYTWNGFLQGNLKNREKRIHPTQKPVALYNWIFQNFAETGQRIIDTHMGSGPSRKAAFQNKLYFEGYEMDPEYFEKAEKSFLTFVSQQTLF